MTSKAKSKIVYPDGFVVVVDTREQTPLFLRAQPPKGLVVVRDKLDAGDYSIRGFESQIAVERKSIPDLYQSMTQGRDRFTVALRKFEGLFWRGLVVEGTEDEVMNPCESFSSIHPNSVSGGLTAIAVRYNLHIYFAINKKAAEKWILDRFIKFYKIKREEVG